jgi:TRAP-type mannitol/chloroaromatic compound transport system substrate-binding protein
MKRRTLLVSAGVAAGTSVGAIASHAQSADQSSDPSTDASIIRWRMATSYPKTLDVLFGATEIFCQRVNALSAGRFIITPYPAGEIAPPLEVLNAISEEKAECGHTFSSYALKQNIALAFGAGVPFGFNAQQQNAWLYEGGGLAATQKIYAKFNVINFPAGNTGGQMGGWFQKEINRVEDFQGLKMRISGLAGKIMPRFGTEVKVFPPDQIVAALVKKEIEAVEFIGPYDDKKLGLHKAAPYYYYPAWWQPGESQDVIINLKQWNQLTPELQTVVKTAAIEANLLVLAKYNAANAKTIQQLKSEGVQLKAFNPEILAAAAAKTFEFYEETAQKDAEFSAIYRPWKTFRDRLYQWSRINDLSFTRFAFKADDK